MPLPSSHTDKADCLAVVIQPGDARDLILQLYREIGISADFSVINLDSTFFTILVGAIGCWRL